MQTKISLIDLVNALEATSHGLEWQVDLVTGDVLARDSRGTDGDANPRFRALPANGALRETESRRAFCSKVEDQSVQAVLAENVETRAFLDHARRAHVLDDFIVHRRAVLADIALEWAAAEHVDCWRDLTPASITSN